MIICNDDNRFITAEQLRQIGVATTSIILEPVGRNTAPAIALAALESIKNGDDPNLLILAADHVIRDQQVFQDCVRQGEQLVEEGKIVTFGIVPTHAETGYGYLQASSKEGASLVNRTRQIPPRYYGGV